ncbi:hypothetical protein BGZ70_005645 [Mortierella alpina]|uniref:F-box domain-containing protein n=1 Tax=Mortierella alpina TaxID=64518 RepID=A0A9P6J8R0_MORAP|nr:hypothetical protein BGZ70_005645 [Mortierella alpina]
MMEPESAVRTVLATPELILLVSVYLAAPDLAHCNLVCKAWSRQFEPILWAHFCPTHCVVESSTAASAVTAAMMRNLPHIRTLDLTAVESTTLQALAYALTSPFDKADQDQSRQCTNLRRLQFVNAEHEPRGSTSLHLAALLNHNPLLTRLDLSYDFLASSAVLAAI